MRVQLFFPKAVAHPNFLRFASSMSLTPSHSYVALIFLRLREIQDVSFPQGRPLREYAHAFAPFASLLLGRQLTAYGQERRPVATSFLDTGA